MVNPEQDERIVCGERLQARDRYESFHPRRCERVATEEVGDKRLCKIHARAARKAADRAARWTERFDRDRAYTAEVDHLRGQTGINVQPIWSGKGYQMDRVSVPLNWFKARVEEAAE